MDEQAMQPARPAAATQWTDMLHAIFPEGVPARYVWHETEAIRDLLQRIAAAEAHRAYAPDGHCFTLSGIEPAGEPGCLALLAGESVHIVKPARLVFEAVNEEDLRWAWFRLETGELPATGKDPRDADCGYERLLETAPGEYTAAQAPAAAPAHAGAHPVIRHLGGMFVFLAEDSPYQLGNETETDGRPAMNPSSFRQALAKMADILFKTANP
jgi:hypothetical protein